MHLLKVPGGRSTAAGPAPSTPLRQPRSKLTSLPGGPWAPLSEEMQIPGAETNRTVPKQMESWLQLRLHLGVGRGQCIGTCPLLSPQQASILELSALSNSEAAHCLLALLPETARGPNVRQPQDGDGGGGQVPRAGRLRAQPLMTGPAAVTPQPLRLARPAVVHFNDEFWTAEFNYPEKKNV